MSQSMYGAVDLSAFASKPAAQENPDGTTHGAIVVDMTQENLQKILDTSNTVPVVAVFRSERSENSLTLDSQLQASAAGRAGAFQLARVDVDAHPEFAQAFRVTGIPAACALLQGNPVPLFQGLPAEGELEPMIDQLLAAAAQYGITGRLDGDATPEPEPELPEHHRAALNALAAGEFAKAREEFEIALRNDPTNQELSYGLAQASLMERVAGVTDPQAVLQEAAGVALTEVDTHLAAADVEVAWGRPDAGFARLIDVVRVNSGDAREKARTRLLELFEVVGPEPVVTEARKALAMALF